MDLKFNKNALKDNFVNALQDKDFVKICNTLDCSDDIKMKYTNHLLDISKQINICKNCKGYDSCPYSYKGMIEVPEVENNIITFCYKACKKKIKFDEEREFSNNVDYYNMPDVLKLASFKNIYKDDNNRFNALNEVTDFYKKYTKGEKCNGIYLHGNFGCGKSYLIAALFNELSKKGYKSIVIYYPELLRRLKDSFSDPDSDYRETIERMQNVPLLLLDDIGAEKVSEWNRDEVLGTILQYRMTANLPTFYTSNLTLKQLEQHFADTKDVSNKVNAQRIIERIRISKDIEMISTNRR